MKVRITLFFAISGLLTLTACEQPQQSAGSVVAARVGDAVISEAELELALSRLTALDKGTASQMRGQVLDALIDQHLVSEAARRASLDKDPQVAMALAHAQRQVLSEAYMAQKLKGSVKPTEAEVSDYYQKHPELFSNRRIYRLQEIDLKLPAARLPEVEAQLGKSQNLSEFSDWLKEQGIESRTGQAVQSAEQIPSVMLDQLKNLEDGQVVVQATGTDQVKVVQLLASQTQAVSLDQAHGAIERVLQSRVRKTKVDAEIKALRRNEKIEYVQGFSPAPASK